MTNKIAKYNTHWTNNETGEIRTISFDVFDTPVARSWLTVIKRKLEQDDVEPKEYSQHGTFPGFADKYEINQKIVTHVKTASVLIPELTWPDNPDDITRDKLNILHEHFHETEEKLFRVKYEGDDMPKEMKDIRAAFLQINHHIHELETIFNWESWPEEKKHNRRGYQVMNFGKYDQHIREPVTPEMREWWRYHYYDDQKRTQLVLGYATVGKNIFHCANDSDVQVVKDGMVRPQIDIGGEAKLVAYESWYPKTQKDVDMLNDEQEKRIVDFIINNELTDYIDVTDKEHLYGVQPQLGIVSDEHDDLTIYDYYEIVSKYKMTSVSLEEY